MNSVLGDVGDYGDNTDEVIEADVDVEKAAGGMRNGGGNGMVPGEWQGQWEWQGSRGMARVEGNGKD